MTYPSVSIIMSVGGERSEHLWNTLRAWSNVEYPDFDFTIVNNGSSGVLTSVANSFKDKLHAIIIEQEKHSNVNVIWNSYGKSARGQYIIFAMMDEIISHKDIIHKMVKVQKSRASISTYFMSEQETSSLKQYDWVNDPSILPHGELQPAGLLSHITGAYREYWDYVGWFRDEEFGHLWLDQDLYLREYCLGNTAITTGDVWCYHQWHEIRPLGNAGRPGYSYENEMQARLLEPAKRDAR